MVRARTAVNVGLAAILDAIVTADTHSAEVPGMAVTARAVRTIDALERILARRACGTTAILVCLLSILLRIAARYACAILAQLGAVLSVSTGGARRAQLPDA
jgi:hypothetical protein